MPLDPGANDRRFLVVALGVESTGEVSVLSLSLPDS